MSRRLFVAFELDAACRRALSDVAAALAARLESVGRGRRLKWVEPANLHVTVRFLGATPETQLAALRAAVARPFASPGFELRLDELGVFPGAGRPRTIWAGASGESPAAAQVHRELEARLVEWGLAREDRPFRVHVTLARFREPGRAVDVQVIREFAMDPIHPVRVDRLTLFESHQQGRGPIYVPLEHGVLGSNGGTRRDLW